ncbi:MAG: TonB-dependent receptor [Pseudomonadota bacterium]
MRERPAQRAYGTSGTGPALGKSIAASACAVLLGASQVGAQDSVSLDIPAQPLAGALKAYSDETGVSVVYQGGTVADLRSSPVSGALAPKDALSRLLNGTGLSTRYTSDSAVTLVAGQAITEGPVLLNELTVTARRFEESLQDVPQSVVVITEEEIEKSNIRNFEDYTQRTPNASFTENGSRGRNTPSIRGLSDIALSGTSSVVGFYLDENSLTPIGRTDGIDTDLLDVERIEVVYGPQGTTFGRNALAGAVNIVSKKPTSDFEAYVEGSVGSFPSTEGKVSINGAILDNDLLNARLTAIGGFSDGFVDLPNAGPDDPDSITETNGGVRLALRSNPIDPLLLDFAVAYSRTEQGGGLNAVELTDFLAGEDFAQESGLIGETKLDRLHLTFRGEYDFGPATLISNTAYFDFLEEETFDGDFSPLPFAIVDVDFELNELSQEFRLESDAIALGSAGELEGVIGGNFSFAESISSFDVLTPTVALSSSGTTEQFTAAAFVDIRYRPIDALEVNLGGRYSRDEVEVDNPATLTTPAVMGSETFSSLDFKAALSYDWTDDLSTYATVATGYRGGGFNPPTSLIPGAPFDEENAISYEVGMKSTWLDGQLLVNAAGFFTDYDNIQVLTPGVLGNATITNAAEARSFGGELTIASEPISGLTLGVTYGYANAEFTDFRESVFGDLTGETLPNAPRNTFSLVGEYSHPVFGDFADAFFRAEYNYQTSTTFTLNPAQVPIDAYGILNLRGGIRADRFDVELFIENATNTRYATSTGILGVAGPFPATVAVGPSIEGGIRARIRF